MSDRKMQQEARSVRKRRWLQAVQHVLRNYTQDLSCANRHVVAVCGVEKFCEVFQPQLANAPYIG